MRFGSSLFVRGGFCLGGCRFSRRLLFGGGFSCRFRGLRLRFHTLDCLNGTCIQLFSCGNHSCGVRFRAHLFTCLGHGEKLGLVLNFD